MCGFNIGQIHLKKKVKTKASKEKPKHVLEKAQMEKKGNENANVIELNKMYGKVERVTWSELSVCRLSDSQLRHERPIILPNEEKDRQALPIHGWIHLLSLKCLSVSYLLNLCIVACKIMLPIAITSFLVRSLLLLLLSIPKQRNICLCILEQSSVVPLTGPSMHKYHVNRQQLNPFFLQPLIFVVLKLHWMPMPNVSVFSLSLPFSIDSFPRLFSFTPFSSSFSFRSYFVIIQSVMSDFVNLWVALALNSEWKGCFFSS